MTSGPRPVLLVHGAWHGAWCWEQVIAGLAGRDILGVAVDLPGHGADSGVLSDLHGDAERVRHALDGFTEPVILVGHSYGGVVITEAGTHPNTSHLVYIASFNLDDGESAMSAAVSESATLDHADRPDVLGHVHVTPDGSSTVDDEGARMLFYNDCPDDIADWAVARLGPQRIETLSQAPRAVAWRQRPSTYAVCTADNIVHPGLQRALARRADNTVEWPTGHSPFLSRPELVVDLLAQVAQSSP